MKRLGKLAMCLAVVGSAFTPRPSLAVRGIYCTSYDFVTHGDDMNCYVVCVGCWDLDNNDEQVSEDCEERSCWFRQV